MTNYKKAVGNLIHAFLTMDANYYTWLSITNNQYQIVQDVQLLWAAGLDSTQHHSSFNHTLQLSGPFPKQLRQYSPILLGKSYIFLLLQEWFFSSWDWWKYVNCLYLRYETFFITNFFKSWSTSFPILFWNTTSKTFLSTDGVTTCQHILQNMLNVLTKTSQILDCKIPWKY